MWKVKSKTKSKSNDLAIGCVLVVFLLMVLFPIKRVSGDSMLPTFKDGDWIITCRIGRYDYGDVLIALQTDDDGNDALVIKRLVGISSDSVKVSCDGVYRNDKLLEEDYTLDRTNQIVWEGIIPDDCYFILGDNRNESYDSRLAGCIKKDRVVGKVIFNLTEACTVN